MALDQESLLLLPAVAPQSDAPVTLRRLHLMILREDPMRDSLGHLSFIVIEKDILPSRPRDHLALLGMMVVFRW